MRMTQRLSSATAGTPRWKIPAMFTVTGRRGVGLGVDTYGTGNAKVEMTGGSVKAGTNEAEFGISIITEFGIGIKATANTDTTSDDVGDDVDVEIDVIRSEITAYSANLDDASTTDYDESSGIGIFADAGSDANGHIVTRIERSTITADTAMKFVDGRTMPRNGICDRYRRYRIRPDWGYCGRIE